ncbi:MAG: P-II family nitrogen regulator [Deltaproteobacteria bacterium]|jgi:nitrogen regulatory protein PII 1|nr:P-II family nitrogen regulator [Deltaproteobacteria bacterium]
MLKQLQAIVRPEKTNEVITELLNAGFPSVTKLDVYGRGKQKGIVLNDVRYDELPKQLLLIVCDEKDLDDIAGIIMKTARTGEGHFGDGRIFVGPVEKAWTISTGKEGL